MQVLPVEDLAPEINDIRTRTAKIVADQVIPYEDEIRGGGDPERKKYKAMQETVKSEGLWAPHLPEEYGGMGIGFLGHAYMNEIMAWSPMSSGIFGCAAPNSGNQTVLVKYGTFEQKKMFLEPLIAGEIQSGFSMTEPNAPGSDPRSLQTRAVRDGDEWVINGHKWFTSNGEAADFFIVMCRTEEEGEEGQHNSAMTQIIVPKKTPGVNVIRSVPVWGSEAGNHCEIKYEDVRVPVDYQLGSRGSGHQAAQDRLGAGRIFHCMNSVGQMWRAFDMMCHRAMTREVHGGILEDKQFIQGMIADSYMDIQASRLMTINAARIIDSGRDPRTEISAIKVFVPNAFHRVVDRAIQVHGALGVSGDTPLAGMYLGARTLRIADGPDEVHRILIAKNVMGNYHAGQSWDFSS